MWLRRARPGSTAHSAGMVEPAQDAASAPAAPRRAAAKPARLREDLLLGLFGIALGLGSAMFPWYVFYNQEKFGVRAVTFDGKADGTGEANTPQIVRIPDDSDLPLLELDHFSTGTTPEDEAASLLDRPFPTQDVPFRLVHVTNGRAMIQDDTGLWVVQRGSVLPDMSRVASIEERGGAWVIVTSTDRVVTITQ